MDEDKVNTVVDAVLLRFRYVGAPDKPMVSITRPIHWQWLTAHIAPGPGVRRECPVNPL